jgi:TetR/AcrR family transcriptional regulator, cholesterol catabolism regulator
MPSDELDREQQIMRQALRLFGQVGFSGTSLQNLADDLGITRPALYYYFSSKEELLWRLIGTLGDQLLEEVLPIVSEHMPPQEKLRKLVASHTRAILGNPDAFKVYFAERHKVGPRRDRQLRRGEEQYMTLYEDVIAEAQESGVVRTGDPQVLARVATGLPNSALRWFKPGGSFSVEEASELFSDAAVKALARVPLSDLKASVSTRTPRVSRSIARRGSRLSALT